MPFASHRPEPRWAFAADLLTKVKVERFDGPIVSFDDTHRRRGWQWLGLRALTACPFVTLRESDPLPLFSINRSAAL